MKLSSLMLVGGLAALFFAQGVSAALQAHVKALQEAQSLTATLNVQPIGGAPAFYKVTFAKPNLLKIESPEGWTLSDGKTLFNYAKKDNSWTEEPVSEEAIRKTAGLKEAFAWRAFFDKDAFKEVQSAKPGASRIVKGTPVSELALNFEKFSATFFVDPKIGFARGFALKQDETDLLVFSPDIQLGKEAMSADAFTFHAPEGAKKSEVKVEDQANFEKVQQILGRSCMPCHGPSQRSGGFEFRSYEGVLASVVPGSPNESRLVQVVSGPSPSMPKMRAPLRQPDIDVISKWIEAGAKKG